MTTDIFPQGAGEPRLISKCDGQRVFLRRGDDSAAADKEDQPDADTAITAPTIRNKTISTGRPFTVVQSNSQDVPSVSTMVTGMRLTGRHC